MTPISYLSLGGKLSGIKTSPGARWRERRVRDLGSRQSSLLSVLGVTLPTILACMLKCKFSPREVKQVKGASHGQTVLGQ
jgi:hypothetical protein